MKKVLFIISILAFVSFDTFAQPSNDECSGAIDLGVIAAPPACG